MCEGLVALLMDRADYNKYMMRSVARDLLASLVFRPIMQHLTPYNINKVTPAHTCCICAACTVMTCCANKLCEQSRSKPLISHFG